MKQIEICELLSYNYSENYAITSILKFARKLCDEAKKYACKTLDCKCAMDNMQTKTDPFILITFIILLSAYLH